MYDLIKMVEITFIILLWVSSNKETTEINTILQWSYF